MRIGSGLGGCLQGIEQGSWIKVKGGYLPCESNRCKRLYRIDELEQCQHLSSLEAINAIKAMKDRLTVEVSESHAAMAEHALYPGKQGGPHGMQFLGQ